MASGPGALRKGVAAAGTLTSAPLDMRSFLSLAQRSALLAPGSLVSRLHLQRSSSRFLSTAATPISRPSVSPRQFAASSLLQRRSFQVGGLSRNLLARMEESANKNPNSPNAQTAFYQALLKANMPAIIVERYQSGRFATNPAVTEIYHKALAMLTGSVGHVQAPLPTHFGGPAVGAPGTLSAADAQAVSQAVAGYARGGSSAVSAGPDSKGGPLHVVVDESKGSSIFRWFKFLVWFGLATYVTLVVLTLTIEALGLLRKSSPKINEVKAEEQKARFTDVHGADEAKEELQEMVDFLRNPEKFGQLGGKLPKGILLQGPPGTGKTLLARAVAGEAGVPFFYMSGSEFDEIYVGVGAKRVRELFAAAKDKSPAIIFIDELDAIGGRRNARDAAYVKQTLNQLLTELDGFDQSANVVIIGATNFPESLDKALTRPGRFDRHVTVDLPDVRGRLAILQHHARKVKAGKDVDLKSIAQTTSGLSGAELENIVNQAAVHASKTKAAFISKLDFDWAKDKVIMGAEKKTMVIGADEKEMTAYHEAGHALVSLFTPTNSQSLYKVTILPRGGSLGHTAYLPAMDRYSMTAEEYLALIDSAMGGKIAEEIVYGANKVTSGTSADLQSATSVAFNMVAKLGMSAKLGNMEYGSRYENLSSETKAMVESEVNRTVNESYERARVLLTTRRQELDRLAQALIKYETLSREEVQKVIRGEDLPDRIAAPKGTMTVPAAAKLPTDGMAGTESNNDGDDGAPPAPPPPAPPGGITPASS